MRFDALFRRLQALDPQVRAVHASQCRVTSLVEDSRKATRGCLFAAVPGTKQDGTAYVPAAIAGGAKALLLPREMPEVALPQIVSSNLRRTLALTAAILNGEPASSLQMVGVTGTKGKTTVAFLMRAIFDECGISSGLIGTVANVVAGEERAASMTTPSPLEIQSLLAEMKASGQGACAMEVSSHALDQERTAGISFAGAIFTNLGHDHLDYHKSFDEYFAAKARLFEGLDPEVGVALINIDDPYGQRMFERTRAAALRYGMSERADIRLTDLIMSVAGMSFTIRWLGDAERFESPLTGRYNAMNLAACIGMALALDLPLEGIKRAVARFGGAPGRLERVSGERGPLVFVDYAHTPDSLENVLSTLREICSDRRLTCVFGCGGDRDRTKRPKMGAIAATIANRVIVTSDNPRTEQPEAIIEEILAGIPPQKRPVEALTDRAAAIDLAIAQAEPTDVVLIAGKGHETYQIFRDRTVHFDDREVAAQAIARHWSMARSGRLEKAVQ
ncbi:MAG: UDP-N-acetylmuramoyl-L-alanyl-D-glutamate--2,6-diaminopimelate ligase [Planctomycetes bacterium]|nr:UDP-N-acetylmuramoyl-L-alanyl-D-glutamate--2,6-diaminopimelate ligase [Planctomycetota bacterium]